MMTLRPALTDSLATAFAAACAVFASATLAQTATLSATVTDDSGRPLADAVVVASPRDGPPPADARARDAVEDQIDKEFVPKVLPVYVGTSVTFPNHDQIRHQVYSFSAAKRFELPLYEGTPARPVTFDKPGVVVLGCNIHDWMIGYVYVSESPYFARTGPDGKATLADLPLRVYVVRVWHPQQAGDEAATKQTVDLTRVARASVEWRVDLKPEAKVRRAPGAARGGRY
jgi:plastocyanin